MPAFCADLMTIPIFSRLSNVSLGKIQVHIQKNLLRKAGSFVLYNSENDFRYSQISSKSISHSPSKIPTGTTESVP